MLRYPEPPKSNPGRTVTVNSKRANPARLLLLALATFALVWLVARGCRQTPVELIVQDGVQYEMISFGSSTTVVEGKSIATYLITFAFPEGKDLRRGTIHVPTDKLQIDSTLLENRIIWDKPIEIEGKQYRTVRWHPRRIETDPDKPRIKQDEPLTRPRR